MQLLSIEPFIPSGPDFEKSKRMFLELGFQITFDAGDYVGFKREACQFILQKYDNKEFAENLMISVKVDSAATDPEFWSSDYRAQATALRQGSQSD